jgi:hypothetical protein
MRVWSPAAISARVPNRNEAATGWSGSVEAETLRSASRLTCLLRLACVLAVAAPCAAPIAQAQEVTGNVITVHPSGIDPRSQEALTAEERLERRLKRSNELLRAICVGCGARDAVSGAAPFDPMQALHAPPEPKSQMLVPHQLPDEVIVEVKRVPVPPDGAGPFSGLAAPADADPATAASPPAIRPGCDGRAPCN